MIWRALSMSQPWLDFVMRSARGEPDPKLVENRKWSTKLRGPFLLHAALSFDEEARAWAQRAGLSWTSRNEAPVHGGFLGVARLVEVLRPDEAPLFGGPVDAPHPPVDMVFRDPATVDLVATYDLRWWMRDRFGFLLADVRPVPFTTCRGKLNFWPVPADLVASMRLPPSPGDWRP